MTENTEPRSGVQVTTRTPPIAFLFLMFKTKVTIDGATHVVKWGTNYYPLDPGRHTIEIGFRYFFGGNMGRSKADVDVTAGRVVLVEYHPPAQIFAAGSIVID
ncbi:MAG: hypothetical protein WCF25_08815 [Acidimicrobiales bacterium]